MQQPPSRGAGGKGDLHPSSPSSTTVSSTQYQQSQGSTPGAAASELRSDAQQLGSKAANRLHSEVDARRDLAASQAKTVSSALERTAGDLDDGAPEWLKSTFREGAQRIQRFAESIEQKDSRQLMRDVESFARERPGMFLAACAAAGFAAARIFKAGDPQSDQPQSYPPRSSFDEPSFRRSENDRLATPSAAGELV